MSGAQWSPAEAGFEWCEWCQSWHAPAFRFCKRDTGEPIPEEGWCLI